MFGREVSRRRKRAASERTWACAASHLAGDVSYGHAHSSHEIGQPTQKGLGPEIRSSGRVAGANLQATWTEVRSRLDAGSPAPRAPSLVLVMSGLPPRG